MMETCHVESVAISPGGGLEFVKNNSLGRSQVLGILVEIILTHDYFREQALLIDENKPY